MKKENGFEAWCTVIGSFISHFVALGCVYSFGVLIYPLQAYFDEKRAVISWIGSLMLASMLTFSLVSSFLIDRYSPKILMIIGALLIALGHLLSSYVPDNLVALLYCTYSLVVGIGANLCFMPALSIIPQWFSASKVSLAVGVAVAGSGVGNIFVPIMMDGLIENINWQGCFRIIGLSFLFLMIVATFLVDRRLPILSSSNRSFRTLVLPVLKQRVFWLFALMLAFANIAYLVPFAHIPANAEDQGYGGFQSSILLSVLGACSTVGRIVFGLAATRYGPKYTMAFSLFVMGICLCCWPAFELTYPSLVVFAAIYGFTSGSVISLVAPWISKMFSPQRVSTLLGLIFALSAISNVVGPPMAAFVFDETGSYLIAAEICGGILFFSFMLCLLLPNDYSFPFIEVEQENNDRLSLLQNENQQNEFNNDV